MAAKSSVPLSQAFELAVYLLPAKTPGADGGEGGGEGGSGAAGKKGAAGESGVEDEGSDVLSDADSDIDALLARTPDHVPSPDALATPSTLVAPREWEDLSPAERAARLARLEAYPDVSVRPEHVHGYGGRGGHANVLLLRADEVVYPAGRLVVVHDRRGNTQRLFRGHAAPVRALAGHRGGEIVASGEEAPRAGVCVWSAYTLELLARLDDVHAGRVAALAFAPNEQQLISAGGDDAGFYVCVYDWRARRLLAAADAGKRPLMDVAVDPHAPAGELSALSVGVKHVCFWALQRGRLQGTRGTYKVANSGSRTMTAAAFTDAAGRGAARDVAFTGSRDGRIYVWRGSHAVSVVTAATGPVFHLIMHGGTLFSGSKDAAGPLRSWAVDAAWPTRLDLAPGGGPGDLGMNPLGAGPARRACVRALAVRAGGGELLVGTSDNSVLAVNLATRAAKLVARGHLRGAITGAAAHPSKPLIASVCEGGRVRVVDLAARTVLAARDLLEPLLCAAWARPEGDRIAVGFASGELRVLEAVSLEDVGGLPRHYGPRLPAPPRARAPAHPRTRAVPLARRAAARRALALAERGARRHGALRGALEDAQGCRAARAELLPVRRASCRRRRGRCAPFL